MGAADEPGRGGAVRAAQGGGGGELGQGQGQGQLGAVRGVPEQVVERAVTSPGGAAGAAVGPDSMHGAVQHRVA